MLNNTAEHCLYFIALDRIAHKLIIETRAGAARVYQCYVESAADETGDSLGFTVREWLTGKPDDPDCPLASGVLAARNRWGGPEAISRRALAELLDLLSSLESQSEQVGSAMMAKLCEDYDRFRITELQFEVDRLSAKEKRQFIGNLFACPMPDGGVFMWSKDILSRPGCVSVILGQEIGQPTVVSSSSSYEGDAFSIEIPADLADPFIQCYKTLVGFLPQAEVFVSLVHFAYCSAPTCLDPLPGQNANGWGIVAMTIPH